MTDLAAAIKSEIKMVEDELDRVKREIKHGFNTVLEMESAQAELKALTTRLHTLRNNLAKIRVES